MVGREVGRERGGEVFDDADQFPEFFIFWKHVYFYFENVQHYFDNKKYDKNKQKPENDSHITDDRKFLVPE